MFKKLLKVIQALAFMGAIAMTGLAASALYDEQQEDKTQQAGISKPATTTTTLPGVMLHGNWIKIGEVLVNSEVVVMGDSGQFESFDYETELAPGIKITTGQKTWAVPERGIVAFGPGKGNGTYPVYGRMYEGRIVEVRIVAE